MNSHEFSEEMDRRFDRWCSSIDAGEIPVPKSVADLAIAGASEDALIKEIWLQFVAEQFENAIVSSGDYLSLPEVSADGTLRRLWKHKDK